MVIKQLWKAVILSSHAITILAESKASAISCIIIMEKISLLQAKLQGIVMHWNTKKLVLFKRFLKAGKDG